MTLDELQAAIDSLELNEERPPNTITTAELRERLGVSKNKASQVDRGFGYDRQNDCLSDPDEKHSRRAMQQSGLSTGAYRGGKEKPTQKPIRACGTKTYRLGRLRVLTLTVW